MENKEKQKRKLYDILAYEEYFVDLMDNIMKLKNVRWYWAYHDKDIKDDGTPKEPHYHILLYFDNDCTLSALMKKIKFDRKDRINYYQKGTDENRLDYRVRYLVHYKTKTDKKYEYPIDIINTNDDTYEKFFDKDTSKSKSDINLIFDFFDSHSGFISYRTFLNYIYSNNLWGTFRQNALIFNRLFDEHNSELTSQTMQIFK